MKGSGGRLGRGERVSGLEVHNMWSHHKQQLEEEAFYFHFFFVVN